MDVLTIPLLALALLVTGSIVIKSICDHARGTGGMWYPPVQTKPSADETTPARSTTASVSEVTAAQKRTPPA